MWRRLIVVLMIVLLVLGGSVGWWLSHRSMEVGWQGYADADFIKMSPTQQGVLTMVGVARGDHVVAGASLFSQDDTPDRAAMEQAQRQLNQSERQLANLQAPARETEIAQAEANLADAVATRDRTEADLSRLNAVVPSGGATLQNRDQARADFRSAVAKVHGLAAALVQARSSNGRLEQIKAQMSDVAALRAAVTATEWRLSQRHVVAPASGIIADVLARPGETVDSGVPVISLLPPGNIFIRFFVPEEILAHVHPSDRVRLNCDHCAPDLMGTVSYIAPQSEYTPPLIYSDENRAKLVFLMEARPDQPTLFNPGEPVLVRPVVRTP
jgi:HlyD family secretion protein